MIFLRQPLLDNITLTINVNSKTVFSREENYRFNQVSIPYDFKDKFSTCPC